MIAIRSFYRDLAEWSHEDPVRWGVWVAPCPVSRALPRAASKIRWRQKSEMQQRTRMLTPLLPAFVAAATDQKRRTALFLQQAETCQDGEEFEVDGCTFVRDSPPVSSPHNERVRVWARVAGGHSRPVWIRGGAKRIDVTAVEEEGFWC